ncbi:MAG TPA: class I SAM-dependent methyltransferase [Vicinamibacterales bacterium]|jgi:SAM-dependent methyltransferase
MLKAWIAHPLARGLDLDDPRTTERRRQIIGRKPFLRDIYVDWYTALASAIPDGTGRVLELGSGAGFLSDFVPNLITSDTFLCPGLRVVLDGRRLPFADGTLRGIAMTNVLHHLPDPRRFFAEAFRCVRPGGVIVMVEPWVTGWSTRVYTQLHHEPFHPDAPTWDFSSTGPLSGANGALPWILFERDRARFEQEFAGWSIELVAPFMPFRYLLSGGVSLRTLMPAWTSGFWSRVETVMGHGSARMAMFARIVLKRLPHDHRPVPHQRSPSQA